MKYVLLILLAMVVACSKTENITTEMDIPTELSDCQFFKVAQKNGMHAVRVLRCPNSTTTTIDARYDVSSKARRKVETVVIDGVSVDTPTR